MSFVSHNGKLVHQNIPLIEADNSSFKWGDGLFETIKFKDGKMVLEHYHFERLKKGLDILSIQYDDSFFDEAKNDIYQLCMQNNCMQRARVRLAVYRNNEGIAETIIQASPLETSIDEWNEKGWKVEVFKDVIKPLDALSNLKTASYLPYILAAGYARKIGVEETFILNSKGTICDGSKTNIFIIKETAVYTPALEEGCVAGVMRRFIISELSNKGVDIVETFITEKDLLEADEMFVSNAIIGIKWIHWFGNKNFGNKKVLTLYKQLFRG